MKSQDILLLLKLHTLSEQLLIAGRENQPAVLEQQTERTVINNPYSVRSLSAYTGIGKSEITNILNRCYFNGLARPAKDNTPPAVNTKALFEFLAYGIRYVFPAKPGELSRGITTTLTSPIFDGELRSVEQTPVWPYAKGDAMGSAIEPIFRTAPIAALQDKLLHQLLALIDSIRVGLPRERNLAIQKLEILLRGTNAKA